ncbi:hypothetical protein E4U19_001810 [Claviceps sp. Clav32 group G5]|nr:hypothetical protein E4U19_001810 [Claviceps sp. Clav32 group G5]
MLASFAVLTSPDFIGFSLRHGRLWRHMLGSHGPSGIADFPLACFCENFLVRLGAAGFSVTGQRHSAILFGKTAKKDKRMPLTGNPAAPKRTRKVSQKQAKGKSAMDQENMSPEPSVAQTAER